MRTSLSIMLAAAFAAAASACAGDVKPPSNQGDVEVPVVRDPPRMVAKPATPPEELPGIDTSGLNARERADYWRWVSEIYAPCHELAVSIAECVKQDRACATCAPAARFLAARARTGAPQNETLAAFSVRFGDDVRKIDLADSPTRGRANAPVTIVVWSDYECSACGYAVPLLDEVLEKHPNEVRLVHKLYPLNSHPHSRQAARAALAAKKQGKYWEMEQKLFANQRKLENGDLEQYAQAVGLDLGRFRRDFEDPKAEEIIERDRAEADKQGLTGTPFVLINGREFDLALFKFDRDLETWIKSEVEIAKKDAELDAIARLGATLTGEGRGPVGPLSNGVPVAPTASVSASAAPSASPGGAPSASPGGVPSASVSAAASSPPKK